MTAEVFESVAVKEYIRDAQVIQFPAGAGHQGTTGTWAIANDKGFATVAASQTGATFIVPVTLHEGDIITNIGISGQGESAANAYTVDYALRATTAVATGCTDAAIQAGGQISKSADYLIADNTDVATPHTVISGESIYVLVTVTTAANTDVELQYISLTINQR